MVISQFMEWDIDMIFGWYPHNIDIDIPYHGYWYPNRLDIDHTDTHGDQSQGENCFFRDMNGMFKATYEMSMSIIYLLLYTHYILMLILIHFGWFGGSPILENLHMNGRMECSLVYHGYIWNINEYHLPVIYPLYAYLNQYIISKTWIRTLILTNLIL